MHNGIGPSNDVFDYKPGMEQMEASSSKEKFDRVNALGQL